MPECSAPEALGAAFPAGFSAWVANIGIRDATDDLLVVAGDAGTTAAGVFTTSRFAGPSVELSRRNLGDGAVRGVAIISKNANVANGPQGVADAHEFAALAAGGVGLDPSELAVASTGVIGRRYPMDQIRAHFASTEGFGRAVTHAGEAATAIMTTDTVPKAAVAHLATLDGGTARIVGIAKGVGMIEPDMATMLAFVFTDAAVERAPLDAALREAVAPTFNSLSVDTDTSTSDSMVVLASGAAGAVDAAAFRQGLTQVCLELTRLLAADGEGARCRIEVTVSSAVDAEQARTTAKAIVNSPLVKTAVFGRDPNWGRIAMAVGKTNDERIDAEAVTIRIGGEELYPARVDEAGLAALSDYLANPVVEIDVDLGLGDSAWTVYGCDLSYDYVRINAEYTT